MQQTNIIAQCRTCAQPTVYRLPDPTGEFIRRAVVDAQKRKYEHLAERITAGITYVFLAALLVALFVAVSH